MILRRDEIHFLVGESGICGWVLSRIAAAVKIGELGIEQVGSCSDLYNMEHFSQLSQENLKNHALKYQKIGWFVLPIHPQEKKPLIKWKHRNQSKPSEMDIKRWWEKYPNARIGIATGEHSGIDVVDIDGPGATERLISICGGLPETIRQSTGRAEGGWHLFFKHNGHGLKNYADGEIDFRTTGGIVVVTAPSRHKSGRCYQWENINPVEDGLYDLLEMPAELVQYFKSVSKSGKQEKRTVTTPVAKGHRHQKLTQLVGKWTRQKFDIETIRYLARGWYESLQDKSDFSLTELNNQVQDLLTRYRDQNSAENPNKMEYKWTDLAGTTKA